MTDSFLERALGSTMPDFQARWREIRRTYAPGTSPSAQDFFGHLVAHVAQALAEGRVAEVTRLFLAIERILGDADPLLAELMETELLRALAEECGEAGISPALVLPHLGPRSRAVWERAQPERH